MQAIKSVNPVDPANPSLLVAKSGRIALALAPCTRQMKTIYLQLITI